MVAGPAPGNLPGQLTSFVGRSRELADASELLARGRLLTISGAGGSGKTRLALEVAAGSGDSIPGGAWFCELASVADPEGVAEAVARSLGLGAEPGADPVPALAGRLRGRRALLLVDNCEHVLEASARLVEGLLLACPDLRVLATSQEPLGVPGELLLRLGALGLPAGLANASLDLAAAQRSEAVMLFVDRLRQADPRFELDVANLAPVVEICRRLDGIPLALELAAARARSVPLSELVGELGDRFRILVGASRLAPGRQQTLEAAVAWTYSLIADPERRAMQRLSVLPGPFTLATAREVAAGAGLEPSAVALSVARLADRSVLELGQGDRYRMPETLRAFALARLEESGEAAAVLARAARQADRAGANRTGLALAREAVARLAADDPERLDLLDLLAGQAERVGDYGAGTTALEELRGALQGGPDLARLANAEMRLSSALPLHTGDLGGASAAARRARTLYRRIGDAQAVLQVENELAWIAGLGGDLAGQRELARAVVRRAKRLAPQGPAHLHALGCLGCASVFAGAFGEAEEALRTGIEIANSQSDLYQVGWFSGILAVQVALTAGPDAAKRLLAEVRPRIEEHLDPVVVEGSLFAKRLAGDQRGVLDEIRSESTAIAGFGFRGAWIQALGAAAAAELGELGTAGVLLDRSTGLFAGRDVYFQSRAKRWLEGSIAWSRGDLAGAAIRAREGAELLLAMSALPIAALALRDLADILREGGREQEARAAELRLADTAKALGSDFLGFIAELGTRSASDSLGRLGFHDLHARSLEAEGRLPEAAAAFERLGESRRRDRLHATLARSGQAPASAVARALRRSLLFEAVLPADLELLAAGAVRGSYRAGEEIHRRHELSHEVGVIEAGAVRLGLSTPSGARLLGEARPGELLGERSLLEGEVEATDAEAIEETRVIWLPAVTLLGFVRSRPAAAERLLTLLVQRLRQEGGVTGEPEPADAAARVLGRLGRLPEVGGETAGAPAFEILAVRLEPDSVHLLRPAGNASWLVYSTPGRSAGDLVGAALAAVGLESAVVHSTSWRQQAGRLVLTYLAVLSGSVAPPGFEDVPVERIDLARGGTHGAPAAIEVSQVVEHGLRHLSWLSRDDPVIGPALSVEWRARVTEYQPEPFRAL